MVATTAHFLLQRYAVFRDERGFALSLRSQVLPYAGIVVCQYLVTVAAMAVLPNLLGRPGCSCTPAWPAR